jgi:hypothetical protein
VGFVDGVNKLKIDDIMVKIMGRANKRGVIE